MLPLSLRWTFTFWNTIVLLYASTCVKSTALRWLCLFNLCRFQYLRAVSWGWDDKTCRCMQDDGDDGENGGHYFQNVNQRWPLPPCDFLSYNSSMSYIQMSFKVIIIKTKYCQTNDSSFISHGFQRITPSRYWGVPITKLVWNRATFSFSERLFCHPLQFIMTHLHHMSIQFICMEQFVLVSQNILIENSYYPRGNWFLCVNQHSSGGPWDIMEKGEKRGIFTSFFFFFYVIYRGD